MEPSNHISTSADQRPVTVITGATGPMGRVIAQKLAAKGEPLVLACRNQEKGSTLAAELQAKYRNPDICCIPLDLGSFRKVKDFVARFQKTGRKIAALVNNATLLQRNCELSEDGYEMSVQVNFLSTILLSWLLAPMMPDGARIVFSTSALRSYFSSLPYEFPAVSKSKFLPLITFAQGKLALTLFSIYLSTTLRTRHILVNCADAGLISSSMLTMARWLRNLNTNMLQMVHNPENAVISTMRALETNETGYIFRGLEKMEKASTILKNREVFIKLCNDTMRVIKKQTEQ